MPNPTIKSVLSYHPPEAFQRKFYSNSAKMQRVVNFMADGMPYGIREIARAAGNNISLAKMHTWLTYHPGFVQVADAHTWYYLDEFRWFADRQGLAYPRDISRWADKEIPYSVLVGDAEPEMPAPNALTSNALTPNEPRIEELPVEFRVLTRNNSGQPEADFLVESSTGCYPTQTDDYMLVRVNSRAESADVTAVVREIATLSKKIDSDRNALDKLIVAVASVLHSTMKRETP